MPSSLVWKEGISEMKAARHLLFSLIVFASFLYFLPESILTTLINQKI
jgi:hypothetical protein